MTEHEYYGELISALLDGEISPEEKTALDAHIAGCESCRRLYLAFSSLDAAVADSLEEPPESLCENIMADLRRSEIKKKHRRLRPVLAAAACLAVVLVGAAGMRGMGRSARADGAVMTEAAAAEEAVPAAAPMPEPAAAPAAMMPESADAVAADFFAFNESEAESTPKLSMSPSAAMAAGSAETEDVEETPLLDPVRMDELREYLGGGEADTALNALPIIHVFCPEDGSEISVFRTENGIFYTDSRDGGVRSCARSEGELREFVNILTDE